jgi:hypothetical protein
MMKAVRRVLHPLVRLLLSQGVQYPLLSELLKSVYVGVANAEFKVEGKRQTQSRITLLTGIHRKDVRRLMAEERYRHEMPADVSLGVQIAALWLSHPDYLNEEGRPAPLPRLASTGGEKSFEALVARISKDIRSRSVLDEWLRLGVVKLGPDDRVHLKADAFIPEKGFEEKVFFLGQNIHDHLHTAVHNVIGQGVPRLERSVFYEGLSEQSVAELAELAHKLGMDTLVAIHRRAQELQERDSAQGQGKLRMNFGLFFYQGPQEEPGGGDAP